MKQWKRVGGVVLSGILALSVTLGGMTAPDAGAKAKKAKLKTKKISVQVGKKKTIKIANKSKTCKYTFTSSKKKVAKVSKKGTVTGVKKGTAKITVKEIKKKGKGKARKLGTVKVTVTKKNGTVVVKNTSTPKATNSANNNNKNNSDKKETPAPAPDKKGVSVRVYSDEIKDANLVTEVDGVGHMPTPTPTPVPAGKETPKPEPAVLVNADMENGKQEPVASRNGASVEVVDGGANDTSKAIKVSKRTASYQGACINVTNMVETGNEYAITFYAKQSTGEASKIDLSMDYIDEDGEHQYTGIKAFDLANDTWTKCETTMTVPAHKGDFSIYWQTVWGSENLMDFYLDEIKMVGVAKTESGQSAPDLSTGLVKGKIGNPVMTSRLTADPWAMEYNGRLYVYGTNDSQQYDAAPDKDNNYSKIRTLNCYSSADMVNWTDHGTINVKGAASWSANSWAPAVCHKTIDGKEKFFLYFANNASSIGVLTADSPTGPWTDPINKPLIDRSVEGCAENEIGWLFDPAVLIDDDGTGYLYFGGIGDKNTSEDFIRNPKCARVVKLGADMVSVDGTAKTIDAPFMFEDSGINKIGNKYYYSYCTNWNNISGRENCPIANIAVMESDSPMGNFKYVGCVLKNPGNYFGGGASGNNHHCFAAFKGKMYAFYHTKKDTIALGTKNDYRTTYVNLLNLGENGDFTNADGTVADTKMTTKGVESIANVDPFETVQAETFAMADTVGTVQNEEANTNKDWLTNYSVYNGKIGGYIGVANVDFGTDGASEVNLKLADSTTNGYKLFTQKLGKKITGKHTIYFVFDKLDVMMDSWSFKK